MWKEVYTQHRTYCKSKYWRQKHMLWKAGDFGISRSLGIRPTMCLSCRSTCEKVWKFRLHVLPWNSWHHTTKLITPHTSLTSAWRSFSQPDIKHVGVCGSSANFPPKIIEVCIYQKSCLLQAIISHNGLLHSRKRNYGQYYSQLPYNSHRSFR